ncbi:tRNA (adenosine(37)-N6)-threonylcarbamoyltransferase complex ATPase subunit type 1 TsaE [Patescibacteria group bacterium]|nr:tRNA (adenosine(37)-N6)-threonylcarbamoyltransferase complex ATPase subunit type 1 TsaE [Patescibacteria group bacterium]
MRLLKLETRSAHETQKIAEILAQELKKNFLRRQAMVIALSGDLGGGKTTFTKGFAKGLGIRENILSPTFLILKTYKLRGKYYTLFTHIDAYRLEKPKEILNLGWRELVKNPKNMIIIEWAKNIEKILPKIFLNIKFNFVSLNARELIFNVREK